MATIKYNLLDAQGNPTVGHGAADFLTGLDAVAQAIQTKLKLFTGEWFENLNEGTPMFTEILGVAGVTPEMITAILTARIRQVPFVMGVTNAKTSRVAGTRDFTFSCDVQTKFGTTQVTYPSSSSSASISG